jgi:predicted TIM-barrel fold metal-dependent hydrolase
VQQALAFLALLWTGSAQASPVRVYVAESTAGGVTTYSYRVVNGSSLAIVGLEIGFDRQGDTPQLQALPLGWSREKGLPRPSVTSPPGWTARVVTMEESDRVSLAWSSDSGPQRDIPPGATTGGFSVKLPGPAPEYRSATFEVILANSVRVAGSLEPEAATTFLGQTPPLVDYHQHLFSPAAAALVSAGAPTGPVTASDLVALLDSAGIRRALVLSVAYTWGNPARTVDHEYSRVRGENDWTARQVAQFPGRLRAFCSLNPLRDYAQEELARCAMDPQLHFGLKLHFGNSDVNVDDPEQLERMREIFRAADRYQMAIAVHMHASISNRRPYGRKEAEIFLNQLLPEAKDVPVQIAHLAGAGRYDSTDDEALAVFVDAVAKHDPRTSRLYFDATGVAEPDMSPQQADLIATRIRQLGVERVLYGSDAAVAGNTPQRAWAAFHRLPLTDAEFQTIAGNLTPYMR